MYSQIWLELPGINYHFFYIFLWLVAALAQKINPLKKPLIGATSISTYLHFEQCMLKNIITHNVSNVFIINLRKEDYIGCCFFPFHNCHVEMFQNFLKVFFKKNKINQCFVFKFRGFETLMIFPPVWSFSLNFTLKNIPIVFLFFGWP
jgi:hypothetical protein